MKRQLVILAFLSFFVSSHGFRLSRKKTQTSKSISKNKESESLDLKATDDSRKLRAQLSKIFTDNNLDHDFLSQMVSYLNTFVIFDCEKPSYIKANHQLVILKNHVLNDHLERIKHPLYNDTDAYMCNTNENVWRVNPKVFNAPGYIGFDDDRPAEADSHFVTFVDEKATRDYLKNLPSPLVDQIVKLALTAIHHPKFFAADKKTPMIVDIFDEQDKKLPKWFRDLRQKQMNALYDKITAKASNFSIGKGPGMKEYLFSDGYSFILFDCEQPSYLLGTKKGTAESTPIEINELKLAFKKMGRCNRAGDRVWRRKIIGEQAKNDSQLNYLTFDFKGKSVGYSPSIELLSILRLKGLCHEYMKFMYHPGYFLPGYSKPPECETGASNDEERKISKLFNEHKMRGKTIVTNRGSN